MDLICEKISNSNDMEVRLLNLGAAIISISVPGADGKRIDLTLGYDTPEDYENDQLCFGSTPGRYANRIGLGQFVLNGETHQLSLNEGRNHLHGGATGFHRKFWDTERNADTVTFTYVSADGENGYPGTLTAHTSYSLNDENELVIKYTATTDSDTIINLTNHAYFNLNGGVKDVLDHTLCLYSDSFTVTDDENTPTGEIRKTSGTPMDFYSPTRLGDVVYSDYEQIKFFGGLDNCFVVNGDGLRCAAVLSDPESGRTLEVDTDMPGVQVYTAQFTPEGTKGRDGLEYGPFYGICLEAQNFPDAPNHPNFPSAVLKVGEEFKATIIYRFKF